ncbi:hypothetical protein D7X55_35115 [Corallococcus sp. AB049A]|uniref:hypothetical protein n=1 Tax=Corallococcus sp. AB049A TaxID=2316721 RepID=UPI000EE2D8A6|nr:hypothetical protein [Corallococcus sp. AB049A]RKI50936.1 hypothetical protein D7X55_35115 [Corallococcus sp. AB049A]
MIDLLLKLIDRLIQLKQYKTQRLERVFRSIIEPTYKELAEIHRDYLQMFEELGRQLPSPLEMNDEAGKRQLLRTAEQLRQRRILFEPVREKVSALKRELFGTVANPRTLGFSAEIDDAVRAMLDYLPDGVPSDGEGSRATALYMAIRESAVAISLPQVNAHGATLPDVVAFTVNDCRQKWDVVCEKFVRLQVMVGTAA